MGNSTSSGCFERMGSVINSLCTTVGRGTDEIGNLQRKNFENQVTMLEQTGVSKNTALDLAYDSQLSLTHSIP